jgi:CPA2 family monovalent cation:H+ antiporter-2
VVPAELITLLAVATGGLLIGRWLRIPPIVVYLLAGLLAGPGGFGWVNRSHTIENLAELGVALLLFGVGIEFSLVRLRRILPRMLTSGLLQVGLTVLLSAVLFHLLGADWPMALFVGFLLALSSTAIVFKIYEEQGVIDAPQGQAAASILLFQDLALVPMMLLVPVLTGPPEGALAATGVAFLKAGVAVGALIFVARLVLPRALELVARAQVPEIFPLVSLLIAFGTALGAVTAGLSLPIGTFLAGLALSGSPYARQVFAEILPLRDAFVAIFFTSIGMLLDPSALPAAPGLVVAMVGLVVVKGGLIGAIVGLLWRSPRLAVLSGMGLAQVGEFSFVLSREGFAAGLIDPLFEQAFLAAAILTMGATPFLMRGAQRLAKQMGDVSGAETESLRRDHVLVVGYGTTGNAVARVLGETGIPFCVVDMNARNVEAARKEKMPVHFGDATRRAVLAELGVLTARAAVVAVADPAATRRIVSLIRQMNGDLRLLVRARYVAEIHELERLGADEVIPSEFETSIEIFARLLAHLGVPRHVVRVQESLVRVGHYRALRGLGVSTEILAETRRIIAGGLLETAQVMEGSEVCGRSLDELALRRRIGVSILNIVRDERPLPSLDGTTRLEPGDLVVLYGSHQGLDRSFRMFEPKIDPEDEDTAPGTAGGGPREGS